jgi:hypothetical protein
MKGPACAGPCLSFSFPLRESRLLGRADSPRFSLSPLLESGPCRLGLGSIGWCDRFCYSRFIVNCLWLFGADCISYTEAGKFVGSTKCVRGKVVRVQQGKKGLHFVDFCEDFRACPFTVIVFAGDLKQVGDVRQLAGREIEIHGPIKDYDGRAEIVLERSSQLHGDAARIPALPKDYDLERHGKFSAGQFSHPITSKKPARKRQPARVNIEDPSQPLSPSE